MNDVINRDPLNRIVVTNFSKSFLEIYQHAILYVRGLSISNEAFDVNGKPLKDTFALVSHEVRNFSNFWKCFDELRRRKNNNIDRWMILPEDFKTKL